MCRVHLARVCVWACTVPFLTSRCSLFSFHFSFPGGIGRNHSGRSGHGPLTNISGHGQSIAMTGCGMYYIAHYYNMACAVSQSVRMLAVACSLIAFFYTYLCMTSKKQQSLVRMLHWSVVCVQGLSAVHVMHNSGRQGM